MTLIPEGKEPKYTGEQARNIMIGQLYKGKYEGNTRTFTLGRAVLINRCITPGQIALDLGLANFSATRIRNVLDRQSIDKQLLKTISEKYDIPIAAFKKLVICSVDAPDKKHLRLVIPDSEIFIPETPTQLSYTTIRPPKITPKETKKTTFLLDNKDVDQIIARIDTKFDAMLDAVDERIDQKIAQKVPQYIPQPQENKGIFNRFWGNGHKSKT